VRKERESGSVPSKRGEETRETHVDDHRRDRPVIRLSTLVQLTHLPRELQHEVLGVLPLGDPVRPRHVLLPDPLQQEVDVTRRVGKVLDTNDTLEDLLRLGVPRRGGDDTGAIDEVDTPHKGDVLPDLGLSRDRSGLANGLLLERVDDRRLADVGVTDETDRDLLLVRVEGRELTEELDEGTLSERVVDRGVESDGRVSLAEDLDPTSLIVVHIVSDRSERGEEERRDTHSNPSRNQVDLVQNVNNLLALLLLRQVRLNRVAASSHRVTGVENMEDNVGGVNDL
jgi:hypothetical protein